MVYTVLGKRIDHQISTRFDQSYIQFKKMAPYLKRWFSSSERSAWIALAVSAALSIGIYRYLYVTSANLMALYKIPDYDLLRMMRHDPMIDWRLVLGYTLLAGLYLVGWRAIQKLDGPYPWLAVLGGAAIAGWVLLWMYPFDAADIFDNITHGRILGIYGGNPFLQVAAQYPSDPFVKYAAWPDSISAYGPLWELLASVAARLAGNGVIANILAFKLLPGIFLVGSIAVVAIFLRQAAPERALSGAWLIAWNPVVLIETLGNGHNDMSMVFWILLAAWLIYRRNFPLAILALVAGGLFKYIPVLLIPAAGLIALRLLPNWSARLRFLLVTGAAGAALVVLAYAPFWHGLSTLSALRRATLFTSSLPSILYYGLSALLGNHRIGLLIGSMAAVVTGLFALWRGWEASREPSWISFCRESMIILMFYLLVTCLWFQQWYAVWLVGLSALLPQGRLQALGLWVSFSMGAKQLIFGPLVFLQQPFLPEPYLELRLSAGTMVLPWLGAWWAMWQSRSKAARKRWLAAAPPEL